MNIPDALIYVLTNESKEIIREFITEDLKFFSKEILKSGKSILKSPVELYEFVKEKGILETANYAKERLSDVTSFIAILPNNTKNAYNHLKDGILNELDRTESNKEKTIIILKLFSYFSTFTLGIISGELTPNDKLAALNIGKKRNILLH